MNKTETFINLLKKKGTGPTMSKSLTPEDFSILTPLFKDSEINITTRATLYTAILTLEKTEDEEKWITYIHKNPDLLPEPLHYLVFSCSETPFQALILRAIRHKNLTETQMQEAMKYFFDPGVPEHEKAAFLEALRLKRETIEENIICYNTLWERSFHHPTDKPIIDLSVGYDGLNRTPVLWPYAAPILAALGFPTIIHGVHSVGPKYGYTPHKLLVEAGKNPHQSTEETVKDIENPDIGWGYVDQSISFPELYGMQPLRTHMVKRPLLATLEKLLFPIHSTTQNYIVTSYTHPPYKKTLQELLTTTQKTDHFMIVRGEEGSIQLPLDRRAPILTDFNPNPTEEEAFVRPPEEIISESILENTRVTYLVATILEHFKLIPKEKIQKEIKSVIESQKAWSHWQKGCLKE
jgi:anthranilate phosphoribosyltransferase